jgi:hypothetical protein
VKSPNFAAVKFNELKTNLQMKAKLLTMIALALTLCLAAVNAKKVHTLGDSTMAPYDESATVTRGWGMYFGMFLTDGCCP